MKDIEISERIAEIFRESRAKSGKSQDYVAKALGYSKKTVQNWEQGLATPNFRIIVKWFDVLDIPMYPYLNSLLHPTSVAELFKDGDEALDNMIRTYLNEMSTHAKRELLFLLMGTHGSNSKGVAEMVTAYLHTPLQMRLNIASSIITNYEICKANNLLNNLDNVLPDEDYLNDCLKASKSAVLDGKTIYHILEEDK